MRIALDARMIKITGIGRFVKELAASLDFPDLNVTLLTKPEDEQWVKEKFGQHAVLITPEPIYSWSEQLLLPARLQKENFDLVHFTNFNLPANFKTPYLLTIHDLTPLKFGGERHRGWASQQAYRYIIKHGVANAQLVTVPTGQVRTELQNYAPIDKVKVLPYAISDIFRSATNKSRAVKSLAILGVSGPYILYVGNYRNHKNVTTLLQAFAGFKEDFPKGQLVLVGPINKNQSSVLKALARQLSLGKELIFTNAITDEQLIDLYDRARLFVLPSFKEGYGFVALEAAARRLPMVISESVPIREVLGNSVLSFNPSDPDQLRQAMAILWHNSDLRKALSAKAYQMAINRHWHNVAHDYHALYQQVFDHHKAHK